jgi:hypothetical protein
MFKEETVKKRGNDTHQTIGFLISVHSLEEVRVPKHTTSRLTLLTQSENENIRQIYYVYVDMFHVMSSKYLYVEKYEMKCLGAARDVH